MRPESEWIVERMDWTDSETFELNVWGKEEIQGALKNCRNGHVYGLMSQKPSERSIQRTVLHVDRSEL